MYKLPKEIQIFDLFKISKKCITKTFYLWINFLFQIFIGIFCRYLSCTKIFCILYFKIISFQIILLSEGSFKTLSLSNKKWKRYVILYRNILVLIFLVQCVGLSTSFGGFGPQATNELMLMRNCNFDICMQFWCIVPKVSLYQRIVNDEDTQNHFFT